MVDLDDSASIPLGTELVVEENAVADAYTKDIPDVPTNKSPLRGKLEESSEVQHSDPVVTIRHPPVLSPCTGESFVQVEVTQSFGKAVTMSWSCKRIAAGEARRVCLSLTGEASGTVAPDGPLRRAGTIPESVL